MAAAAVAISACNSAPAPDAHIRATAGETSVLVTGADAGVASVGRPLFADDFVQTGEDGSARIEFNGGNILELSANTLVEIGEAGALQNQIGAVVVEGQAKVRSQGSGKILRIALPFADKTVEIGTDPVEIVLDQNDGLSVVVGSVELVDDAGLRSTIDEGSTLTVDGVVIEVGDDSEEAPADKIAIQPITLTLVSNPNQTEIRRSGARSWSRPTKRTRLQPGDSVRTKRTGASLTIADSTQMFLLPRSELSIDEAGKIDTAIQTRLSLSRGQTTVNVKRSRDDQASPAHVFVVAGAEVRIAPGLQKAAVRLTAEEKGQGRVGVQFGRASIDELTVVGPGQAVDIADGKTKASLEELTATSVHLKPGLPSTVYYASNRPAVLFTWGSEDNPSKNYRVELSTAKSFERPVFAETLSRNRFVYENPRPGQYYWRVKGSGEWEEGTFRLAKGSPSRCGANCKRENRIRDTGVKTVVYFQQALPSITLTWKEQPGAAAYRLKVFRDGEFERPFVDQTLEHTEKKFVAGRFAEGKYFWLVNALDGDGEQLHAGDTNGLEIAFDNSNVNIQITSPYSNQRVRGERLVTAGEVPLGQKLFINGKRAGLDRKGRFRRTLVLAEKGRHRITYRILTSDGTERYYVRDVYRM
ncbi:MAG: hypothetical protein AAFQ65_01290 [Myxococcota bacterium]